LPERPEKTGGFPDIVKTACAGNAGIPERSGE